MHKVVLAGTTTLDQIETLWQPWQRKHAAVYLRFNATHKPARHRRMNAKERPVDFQFFYCLFLLEKSTILSGDQRIVLLTNTPVENFFSFPLLMTFLWVYPEYIARRPAMNRVMTLCVPWKTYPRISSAHSFTVFPSTRSGISARDWCSAQRSADSSTDKNLSALKFVSFRTKRTVSCVGPSVTRYFQQIELSLPISKPCI